MYLSVLRITTIASLWLVLSACGNQMKFEEFGSRPTPDNSAVGNPGDDINDGPGGGDTGGGTTGGTGEIVENFNAPFPPPNAIDILFVVDDSRSMAVDHQNIGSKFPGFINELRGVEWQIAMTTTDSSGVSGRLVPLKDAAGKVDRNKFVLTPAMQDAQQSFNHSIQMSATGNGSEKGIASTLYSLQKRNQGTSTQFFRYGTPLAVVIVSDEDENSNAYGRTANNPVPSGHEKWTIDSEPLTLVNYAQGIPGMSLTVHSIAIPPGDGNCLQKQKNELSNKKDAYEANVYVEAVKRTGGVFGSICSTDFTKTLSNLGKGVRAQLTSFTLKYLPKPNTVQVTLNPPDSSATWTLNGNKIFFNKALNKGTVVTVRYQKK